MGKSGSTWGKGGCIWVKVVVVVQNNSIWANWFYLGKLLLFWHKSFYLGKKCCICVKWLYLGKFLLFGQKFFY